MDFLTIAVENAQRLALLAVPAVLGAIIGRARLFPDNEKAVDVLNIYALYVGFPALVYRGVIDDSFAIPSSLGFWLTVPIAHGLFIALLALFRPPRRGTLALVALFGNIAYLGLPLVIGIFGDDVAGVTALIVAIHVTISVTAGPYLLRRWDGDGSSIDFGKLLRLPLVWAPILGLLSRWLPTSVRSGAELVMTPLAASAAPVALFLLGLYVWCRRDTLFGSVPGAAIHIGVRLLAVPVVTAGVAIAFVAAGMLDRELAQIFIVLSGMPAAITTFSIAHDAGIGSKLVATTIVRTTFLAILTLPVLAALVMLI